MTKRRCASNPKKSKTAAIEETAVAEANAFVGAGASYNKIPYNEGVARGKALVAEMDIHWWALCELADRVEPKYGKETYKNFFADVGLDNGARRFNVYDRWRDIFATWATEDGTSAPGPESVPYVVLRELQSLDDRDEQLKELLEREPKPSKADALKIVLGHHKKAKASVQRRDKIKAYLDALDKVAQRAQDLELKLVTNASDYYLLRELTTPKQRDALARKLEDGSDALKRSAEVVKHIDQHITDLDVKRSQDQKAAAERLEHERAALATEAAA